jgi:hypothetical protein
MNASEGATISDFQRYFSQLSAKRKPANPQESVVGLFSQTLKHDLEETDVMAIMAILNQEDEAPTEEVVVISSHTVARLKMASARLDGEARANLIAIFHERKVEIQELAR